MPRFNKWLLLALLTFVTAPNSLAGGGWVVQKRTFYAKLRMSSFRSNHYYDLAGNLNTQGAQFRQTSVDLYAEYGLTSRLTLIANVPVFRQNSFANTTATSGFGDALLELKYGVLMGPVHVAIGVAPQLPTGASRALVDNRNVPGDRINLPIGDGDLNVWNRLYASVPISSRGYVSFDAGYNLRTQGFSDQYAVGAEVGYKLGSVGVNGTLRRLNSVGTPDPTKGSFVYGEGLEFTAFMFGVAVPITKNISLTADYSNMIGPCRNTYSGPIYGVGIAIQSK